MMAVGLTLLFLAGAKWRYILPTLAGVVMLFGIIIPELKNKKDAELQLNI